ncbi:MAG: hypothetical protein CM1200mP29_08440 [Verrucomicrobiota bacterium]|nr:MAG: hypothetical protein CM1200mP29_08440 [Verrucomicrobiota bacterium]
MLRVTQTAMVSMKTWPTSTPFVIGITSLIRLIKTSLTIILCKSKLREIYFPLGKSESDETGTLAGLQRVSKVGAKMLAEDEGPGKMEMDIIDEQLDTFGQTFMGMTLGCARCHDQKF